VLPTASAWIEWHCHCHWHWHWLHFSRLPLSVDPWGQGIEPCVGSWPDVAWISDIVAGRVRVIFLLTVSQSVSQSVSPCWCRASFGTHGHMLASLILFFFSVCRGASSLTGGRVCRFVVFVCVGCTFFIIIFYFCISLLIFLIFFVFIDFYWYFFFPFKVYTCVYICTYIITFLAMYKPGQSGQYAADYT
jgi:hypothetical protein